MPIHCIGLNHKTADLAFRERLAFSESDIAAFLNYFSKPGSKEQAYWEEIIILSTCNRFEIYSASRQSNPPKLLRQLSEFSLLSEKELNPYHYHFVDEQAVSHLFRVASGMDSMVIGEAQILGQVSDSYEFALDKGTSGKTLSRLFQAAIHTGKRVRSETAIGEKSVSIASLAAKIISQKVENITDSKVVLLGSGEMAELAVEALRKRGVTDFHILSRSITNACKLAERWQGKADTLESLPQSLSTADVLITSTSAPHTIVSFELISSVMEKHGSNKSLTIVDIAVPRDVQPEVGDIPNVYLYDIDNLNHSVVSSQRAREQEIPKAEKIILGELDNFIDYMATEKIIPIIIEMRLQADRIRKTELDKALKKMTDLEPHRQEQLEYLTQSIVNKILHSPTKRLREEAGGSEISTYSRITQALFGIRDAHE